MIDGDASCILIYYDAARCSMWEVEPTLVWRVKRNGKWRYERARWAHVEPGLIRIEYPRPPDREEEE